MNLSVRKAPFHARLRALAPLAPLAILSAVCVLAVPALAQDPPRLAVDLAPGNIPAEHYSAGYAALNRRATFLSADNDSRTAIWGTDGTAETTRVLGVVGPPTSGGELLGSTGSLAFYKVTDYSNNLLPETRIWRTDTEPAGTFPVTAGYLIPKPVPGDRKLLFASALGDFRLFFTACTPAQGCEVWTSDGLPGGTGPAAEIAPGADHAWIREMQPAGDQAFVLAGKEDSDVALWIVHGQDGGTTRLASVPKGRMLTIVGRRRAFFVAENGAGGEEIWTSDGTEAGTRPLTGFAPQLPFQRTRLLKAIGDRVFFLANDRVHGFELWSLAGSSDSLRQLTNFPDNPTAVSSIERAGSRIVFAVSRPQKASQLWSTQGNLQSTAAVGCAKGCPAVDSLLMEVKAGRLAFKGTGGGGQNGEALWVTDGTGAGTRLLKRTQRRRQLVQATSANGRALFVLTDPYVLGDLWLTDGTVASTFQVSQGGPVWTPTDGWSGPVAIAGVAATPLRLVFPARTRSGARDAVWASNGTPAGTAPISTDQTGRSSNPQRITAFRDGVLVQTCTGASGTSGTSNAEMWFVRNGQKTLVTSQRIGLCAPLADSPIAVGNRAVFITFGPEGTAVRSTDGTAAGTVDIITPRNAGVPLGLARFGNQVAVAITRPSASGGFLSQIWATDGTPAGTRVLVDLPNGTWMFNLMAAETTEGSRLFFFNGETQNGIFGWRPWVSDGTAAGSRPLTAVAGSPYAARFAATGGEVYFPFTPSPGATPDPEDLEIWRTDGTPQGTGPAVDRSAGMLAPDRLTSAQDRLYFTARQVGDASGRLFPWVSDGTNAGTQALAEAWMGSEASAPLDLTPFVEAGGRVYFPAADAAHGDELWSTDGTPAGTRLARDIYIGPLGSHPRGLAAWDGQVCFRAHDSLRGMEPWTSDGSAEGTRMLKDLSPGASWSTPMDLTPAADGLYFSAHDGVHGRELWVQP